MQGIHVGARVYVIWTDGGSYPATVAAASQGFFQVRWDSGGAPVWAPVSNVSLVPHGARQAPAYPAPPGPHLWAAQGWNAPGGAAQGHAAPHAAHGYPAQHAPQGYPTPPNPAMRAAAPAPQAQPARAPHAQHAHPGVAAPPAATPATAATPPATSVATPPPAPGATASPSPAPSVIAGATAKPTKPVVMHGAPARPMKSEVHGLPRGLVFDPSGSGPGNGKAFFYFSGLVTVTDTDMAMRMTDIEHLGDDVAALRAAGYRVIFDLHGNLDGLKGALACDHPEAQGLETAGVLWSGHGQDDGSLEDFEGFRFKPDKIEEASVKKTTKLFVLSACYSGNAAEKWQKLLGPQAMIIGWGAPITNARAVDFLTPDDQSGKELDDLLTKHLGVPRVAEDGMLGDAKDLSDKHETKIATLLLSFDELVDAVNARVPLLRKREPKSAIFLIPTPPSKDHPDKIRSQFVRVQPLGPLDSFIIVSSLVGPYSEALDLPRAIRLLDNMINVRVTLSKLGEKEFVFVESTHRRRRLDPLTFSRSIGTVAMMADRIEDMFFGSDER